jgi:hypothetical protein
MDTTRSHGSPEHGMQIDASVMTHVVTQLLLPRGSRCFDVCCCCHGNAPLVSDALRSNFLFFFASIDVRVLRGDIVQENDDDDDDDDDDVALLLAVLPAGLPWILLRGTLVVVAVAVAVVVVAVAVVLILDTDLDFVLTMDAVCVETRPKRDEAPSVVVSTLPHFAASFFRRSSYMARSCRQGHTRAGTTT